MFAFTTFDNELVLLKEPEHRSTWPSEYFYLNEIMPLKKYSFGNDLLIPGPLSPVPYFERYFGMDWHTPKKTHDHSNEL